MLCYAVALSLWKKTTSSTSSYISYDPLSCSQVDDTFTHIFIKEYDFRSEGAYTMANAPSTVPYPEVEGRLQAVGNLATQTIRETFVIRTAHFIFYQPIIYIQNIHTIWFLHPHPSPTPFYRETFTTYCLLPPWYHPNPGPANLLSPTESDISHPISYSIPRRRRSV